MNRRIARVFGAMTVAAAVAAGGTAAASAKPILMPTVSIVSGTTGWFLAVWLGYTALDWPAYGWVAAALILVTLMTIQGLGFLTPVNVLVCLELQKVEPDLNKISAWMQRYFYAVAIQGVMQVAIIVIMTRFRTGV